MPHAAIARELAELGNSDLRLLSRLAAVSNALEANRVKRCELLQQVAGIVHDAGLIDAQTESEVVEPKDGNP